MTECQKVKENYEIFNFIVWNNCQVHYSKSVPAFWFYWKRAVLEKVCNTSQLPTEDDPTQLMHGMQFWEKADCKIFQQLCAAATAGFACVKGQKHHGSFIHVPCNLSV